MKLFNVGCGGNRPGDPWVNLDNLRAVLKEGTPERANLDAEKNYVDWDLTALNSLPFRDAEADGILLSHVIEHLDCHQAAAVLKDCRRVLKPSGLLVVSVPSAEYFLSVWTADRPENAVRLFGEPIHDQWQTSFFDYALFHREHKQILTDVSLRCLFVKGGFRPEEIMHVHRTRDDASHEIHNLLNRRQFSLELMARRRAGR